MNIKGVCGGLLVAAFAMNVQAQLPVDGVHYPAGLDNIRSTVAPVPGFYFRDDNLFYNGTADALPDYTTYVYLQAPRLGWWSEEKILGANYGADVMLPVIYRQASYDQHLLDAAGVPVIIHHDDKNFGLGDILIEPVLLHWNFKRFDVLAGAGIWVPTGQYNDNSLANLGDGKWSPMTTLGVVWHPDQEKKWAAGLLNRFEFNCQQPGTRYTTDPAGMPLAHPTDMNCSTYTMEWEISRNFLKDFNAGVFGYYQKQFTHQGSASIPFADSEAISIGPEVSTDIKRWNLSISLRYAYEFSVFNRPQGNLVNLLFTKRF